MDSNADLLAQIDSLSTQFLTTADGASYASKLENFDKQHESMTSEISSLNSAKRHNRYEKSKVNDEADIAKNNYIVSELTKLGKQARATNGNQSYDNHVHNGTTDSLNSNADNFFN